MLGWVPGYNLRVPVATNHAQVPGLLTDWPMYVSEAGFPIGFWDNIHFADGRDIRWTLADGETVIPHELVAFDRTARTMQTHVLLPAVAAASATNIYCYIGNRFATMPSAAAQQATWDGHEAVYHLEEELAGATGADLYVDSSDNGNQGLDYTASTGQSGQVGSGQQFDGASDYIETETFQATFRGSFSASCWIKPDDGQPAAVEVPWGSRNAVDNDNVWLSIQTSGKLLFNYESDGNRIRAQTAAAVFSNGQETWHHVVCVADSTIGGVGGLKLYLDGVEQTLDAGAGLDGDTTGIVFADWTSPHELFIGAQDDDGSSAFAFAGDLDQWALISRALTAADVAATFANQSSPTTFYTVSPVETMAVSGAYPRRA